MRCLEVCGVGAKQVRCQFVTLGNNQRRHFAHQWAARINGGGRMEVHWRTKPETKQRESRQVVTEAEHVR